MPGQATRFFHLIGIDPAQRLASILATVLSQLLFGISSFQLIGQEGLNSAVAGVLISNNLFYPEVAHF